MCNTGSDRDQNRSASARQSHFRIPQTEQHQTALPLTTSMKSGLTFDRFIDEHFVPRPVDDPASMVSDEQSPRFPILAFGRVIKVGKQFETGGGDTVAVDVFDQGGHGWRSR
jgi:hypothetical protein